MSLDDKRGLHLHRDRREIHLYIGSLYVDKHIFFYSVASL